MEEAGSPGCRPGGSPTAGCPGLAVDGGCSWPTQSPGSDLSSKKGQPRPSKHRCVFVELQRVVGGRSRVAFLAEEGQMLAGGEPGVRPPSPGCAGSSASCHPRSLCRQPSVPRRPRARAGLCARLPCPVLSLRTPACTLPPLAGDLDGVRGDLQVVPCGSRGPLSKHDFAGVGERPALCPSPSGHRGARGVPPRPPPLTVGRSHT